VARILLIDDESCVRAAIALALEAQGHIVVGARSGPLGLQEFDRAEFDIAVIDVFMPGMDGIKVIRGLRQRNPSLPVIAISGVHMRPIGRTALDVLHMARDLVGIVWLQKPFRPAELARAIEKATTVRATADEVRAAQA